MDEKLAVELAYKNGYEQGVKDLAERLKNNALLGEYPWDEERVYVFQIDTISEELLKGRAKG